MAKRKSSIYVEILVPVILLMIMLFGSVVVTSMSVFDKTYTSNLKKQITDYSEFFSKNISSFMDGIYNLGVGLSYSPELLSMDGDLQTTVLVNNVKTVPYFELLYIQDMDGNQTARSSGTLGNRKDRWWFTETIEKKSPFVSKSYFSISTGSTCASMFFPMFTAHTQSGCALMILRTVERTVMGFNGPISAKLKPNLLRTSNFSPLRSILAPMPTGLENLIPHTSLASEGLLYLNRSAETRRPRGILQRIFISHL